MGENIIPTYHIDICGSLYIHICVCIYVYIHIHLCVEGVLAIWVTVYVCIYCVSFGGAIDGILLYLGV